MAPCFSFCFDPHSQPKFLSSFLKTFCFPSCHGPCSSSSSAPSSADESDLDDHHVYIHTVIILEIRQRAMMKARSQARSTFMIMTEEELERLIRAAPPPQKGDKSDDAEGKEKKKKKKNGFCEGDDESEEEFFSVGSCFSRCSSGEEEYCLGRKMTTVAVTLSEEWFRECEGWPFGLWRRRKVVVLPPLPKSPAESWIWHKRNMINVKI